MSNILVKVVNISAVLSLLIFSLGRDLSADTVEDEFKKTIKSIEQIPYNPRPIPTDTADVTGISEAMSRTNFLANFTRVEIPAPANGKTFASSNPANHPDITLVGYLRKQTGPGAGSRPGIVLTHGGIGTGSIANSSEFIIHIANVLFANGYHVLAVDRRDGVLSRCAYLPVTLAPDPSRSQPSSVGGNPIQDCGNVGNVFRNSSFTPNTLVSDRSGLGGDILAAAKYLQDQTGATIIGALGGSRGGLHLVRATSIQGHPDTDFPAGLLDVALVLSPVGDENTDRFSDSSTTFPCSIVKTTEFYSINVPGTGIRDFTANPVGAVEDLFGIISGVKAIENVDIPIFIIHTLTDDQVFIHEALAYKAKTDNMKLGETLLLARLGHFHEIWQADPFWMDQVVLTYFKGLLAKNNFQIGENPGFSSLGPDIDNPLIVNLKFKPEDADKFVSQESIVPFLRGVCSGLPPP
jgi:dienelactone hydrolase